MSTNKSRSFAEQPTSPILTDAVRALEEYRKAIFGNNALRLEHDSALANEAIQEAERNDVTAIRSEAKQLRRDWSELTVLALLANTGALLFQLQLPCDERAEELRGQRDAAILNVIRGRLGSASRDIQQGIGRQFAGTLAERERELQSANARLRMH